MNDKLPPTIIVELADGSLWSADFVGVLLDGPKYQVAHKIRDSLEDRANKRINPSLPDQSPEQAALDHANWAVGKLHEVMGLKTPF